MNSAPAAEQAVDTESGLGMPPEASPIAPHAPSTAASCHYSMIDWSAALDEISDEDERSRAVDDGASPLDEEDFGTELLSRHRHHWSRRLLNAGRALFSELLCQSNKHHHRQVGEGVIAKQRPWTAQFQHAVRESVREGWQPWVGAAAVGVLAALLASLTEIVTHWVSDLRHGMCSYNALLPRELCCIGSPGFDDCPDFDGWASAGGSFAFLIYASMSISSAMLAAWLCSALCREAAGSGVVEIKCMLSGVRISNFISPQVLMVKLAGLPLAVGSGMSIGKEGPFVHIGCCVADVVGRCLPYYRHHETRQRDLLSCGVAAGVAVAFGAPIGGVIFALEEVTTFFSHRTMLQAFFTTMAGTLALKTLDPMRSGRLVQFAVSYRHSWHWSELFGFIFLGLLGGVLGTLIVNAHAWAKRQKWITGTHPVIAAGLCAGATAVLCYPVDTTRYGMLEVLSALFTDCSSGALDHHAEKSPVTRPLCEDTDGWNVLKLLYTAAVRTALLPLSFGIVKVPAGCFVPSLFIGAATGRAFGILLHHVTAASGSWIGLRCGGGDGQESCIVPGVYAIVCAASTLTGVTRMSIALVVIMFELTGGLEYVVPTMAAIVAAKWMAEVLGAPSIYDVALRSTEMPYIDPKDECRSRERVITLCNFVASRGGGAPSNSSPAHNTVQLPSREECQQRQEPKEDAALYPGGNQGRIIVLCNGMTLSEIERIVMETSVNAFPIVAGRASLAVVGLMTRAAAQQALQSAAAQRAPFTSTCVIFGSSVAGDTKADPDVGGAVRSGAVLDWSRSLETCMIRVSVQMSIRRLLFIFAALGSHQVIVMSGASLVAVITRKDLLTYLREGPE